MLKSRFLTKFPIGVTGSGGISARLVNGRLQIVPSWTDLALESTTLTGTRYIWALNPDTGVYTRLDLGGIGAALTDDTITARLASQAEAYAGVNATKIMSPLRVDEKVLYETGLENATTRSSWVWPFSMNLSDSTAYVSGGGATVDFKAHALLKSTYTPSHAFEWFATLAIEREATGSTAVGYAQPADAAVFIKMAKTNYLTSTVTGEVNGQWNFVYQGKFSDAAGYLGSVTKTYNAVDGTGSATANENQVTLVNNLGTTLASIHCLLGTYESRETTALADTGYGLAVWTQYAGTGRAAFRASALDGTTWTNVIENWVGGDVSTKNFCVRAADGAIQLGYDVTRSFLTHDINDSCFKLLSTDGSVVRINSSQTGNLVLPGSFNWDATNGRLGVGTASPQQQFHAHVAAGVAGLRASVGTSITEWYHTGSAATLANYAGNLDVTVETGAVQNFKVNNVTKTVVDATGFNVASGTLRMAGTQIATTRQTGYGAPTGTATRTTFATGSVTLPQLAERVKALIDDLTTHGLIGA